MSYLPPRRTGSGPLQIVLFLTAGAAIGLGAAWFAFAPRVVSVSPASDSRTGSFAAIEIRFSIPMDRECTADHFSVEPAVEGELTVEGSLLRFAPADPWPEGATVRASIRSGACSTRGLPLWTGRTWSFSPSLVRIAYIPIGETETSLMGVAIDGGEPVVLARSNEPIRNFDVSPRGDFAVFSTAAAASPGDLWISRLDGGPADLLLGCGGDSCRDPAVSPDGSRIAFVRQAAVSDPAGPPRIEWLETDTGVVHDVSPEGNNPVWSPQGWLSYYDPARLFTVVDDLAGGRTFIPNDAGTDWEWLPDGSALILPEILVEGEAAEDSEGSTPRIISRLVQVEVDTNQRTNLSGSDPLEDYSPAVSPGGKQLAFSRNFFDDRWTPGRQLWIMDMADRAVRRISLAPDYSHSAIRWSPDGSLLVYMMFHETVPSDPPEIWCIGAGGADPRRLAVGGFLPQWLP
jgi:dipeptidyl aminopeptidase/acylaminoacyl peptidase